jgi:mRNA-degrading endonuclease RelE of RelBE toxin-antitoxin system
LVWKSAFDVAARAGTHGEFWMHRVGDYRLIAPTEDQTLLIPILGIGHPSGVYK